jgi:tryptophan synthase alpha chain
LSDRGGPPPRAARGPSLAERWRALGKTRALIPYLTAGFPTRESSRDALRRVAAAGADIVEVGVPFSDPLADGPTIQRTTQTALEQGMTLPRVLELIHEAALEVPVVIMTYLNPVLALGVERFIHDAVEAGVAGVLLTDLPAGADEVVEQAVTSSSLSLIRLVAPTTDDRRLLTAVKGASGFVYLISRLGVTGARDSVPTDLEHHVGRIRAVTRLPIVVGFGISTPAQAQAAARVADGVVVGSALMDALASGGVAAAERLARDLAAAVHT